MTNGKPSVSNLTTAIENIDLIILMLFHFCDGHYFKILLIC